MNVYYKHSSGSQGRPRNKAIERLAENIKFTLFLPVFLLLHIARNQELEARKAWK